MVMLASATPSRLAKIVRSAWARSPRRMLKPIMSRRSP
jgi:hypothetical protein